ncbi:hypothetical protein ACO0LF_27485 [Undibacterium sp. Di27W]|uniref:hypothetical protein n=1 Tax=Undibacterium sp. Di27W TaxID=3413036 RepID=UPI003BF2366D
MPTQPERYSFYCKHGITASLLLGLFGCSSTMPVQPSMAFQESSQGGRVLSEYRSQQVEVSMIRQQYIWRFPDANQHLAQFSRHIQLDGTVPVRLQDFVITYRKPLRFAHRPATDAGSMLSKAGDEVQISRNEQFLVTEVIAPEFTGEQSYRRLEAARLKVGDESYVLTVANGFLHRPLWLAIYAADGRTVYRIGLPHGHWQFTEHADGISMVDTSGSGRRVLIRPEHE